MKFCQSLIDIDKDFGNVIFTDESTVSMNRFGKLSFYKVSFDENGKRSIEVEKLWLVSPKILIKFMSGEAFHAMVLHQL